MMEFALWSSSLPTHRSQEDCANPVMTVVFQLGKCSRTPQLFCPRDCGVSEPTLLSLCKVGLRLITSPGAPTAPIQPPQDWAVSPESLLPDWGCLEGVRADS